MAANAGTATSNSTETISLNVPESGGGTYRGAGPYTTKATFKYSNPNCEIHLYPWDWGTVSSDLHSVTYADAPSNWTGYDITPVITSLNPDTVPPGPATVTVGGYGFGSNPTVIIGPASAPVAVLSGLTPSPIPPDDSGNPTVTISFTVPDSYLGSTLDVVVQSTGESGYPFQQVYNSKPQSKAVQLGVQAAGTPACGDQRDAIIQQYIDRGVMPVPQCAWFTQTFQSQFFSFDELRDKTKDALGQFTYGWALIRNATIPLDYGLANGTGIGIDYWRLLIGSAQTANSGYRTPANNFDITHGSSTSRHMFGDALDLGNASRTQEEWNIKTCLASFRLAIIAGAVCPLGRGDAGADFVEPKNRWCGLACNHADWGKTSRNSGSAH